MSNDTFRQLPDAGPATDAALLAAAALGAKEACDEFFEIYEPVVRRYVRQAGGNKARGPAMSADGDDIVMEVLDGVLRDLPRFERGRTGSFRNYLRTRVRNDVVDCARKIEARREIASASSIDARPSSDGPGTPAAPDDEKNRAGGGPSADGPGTPLAPEDEENPDGAVPGVEDPDELADVENGDRGLGAANDGGGAADARTESRFLLLTAAIARVFRTAPGLSRKTASIFLHRFRGDAPGAVAKRFGVGGPDVSNAVSRIVAAAKDVLSETTARTGLDPYYDLEDLLAALFDDRPVLRDRIAERLPELERPRDLAALRREIAAWMQSDWGATHLGSTKLN